MRLDGAVAALHDAYPRRGGLDDAQQERQIPQEHRAYDRTITLNKPVQGAEHSSLDTHRDDRAVRSSPADRRGIPRLSHNDPITRVEQKLLPIHSIDRKTLLASITCIIYSLSTCDFLLRSIPRPEREVIHLLLLSICNDRHSALHGRNWRPSGLSRYARGRLVAEEEEEVVGRLKGRLTRS